MTRKPSKPTPARPRTGLDVAFETLPLALAAGTCAIALAQPDWPGHDLLRTAGLLFFIEFPLAVITLFSGVLRIDDRSMARGTKLSFLLLPTLALALLALVVLGVQGVIAVAWLSASQLYRLLSGAPPRAAAVPGFWITFQEGDGPEPVARGGVTLRVSRGGRKRGQAREWRVQGGVEQFDAVVTMMLWMAVAFAVYALPLPSAGISDAYAGQVGWDRSAIGALVPPAKALWAGLLLFGLLSLSKLEALEAKQEPIPKIEDDPELMDIVRKVDADARARKAKR